MACSCHGKNGESVHTVKPYDQCTTCARKHVKSAWSKWNEFTYEDDNRDYVSAQLRDAADHLKFDHKETALKCRDLAVAIEEVKDQQSIAEQLENLLEETRNLYYVNHPDAAERLEKLRLNAPHPTLT